MKEENPRLLEQKLETEDALKKWRAEREARMRREGGLANYSTNSDEKKENKEKDGAIEKKLLITMKDAKATKRYLVVKKDAVLGE